MTTSVTVKARAWGAKVTKGDETHELDANEDRTFHLGETESLTVTHGEKPADVPVEEENKTVSVPSTNGRKSSDFSKLGEPTT